MIQQSRNCGIPFTKCMPARPTFGEANHRHLLSSMYTGENSYMNYIKVCIKVCQCTLIKYKLSALCRTPSMRRPHSSLSLRSPSSIIHCTLLQVPSAPSQPHSLPKDQYAKPRPNSATRTLTARMTFRTLNGDPFHLSPSLRMHRPASVSTPSSVQCRTTYIWHSVLPCGWQIFSCKSHNLQLRAVRL